MSCPSSTVFSMMMKVLFKFFHLSLRTKHGFSLNAKLPICYKTFHNVISKSSSHHILNIKQAPKWFIGLALRMDQ